MRLFGCKCLRKGAFKLVLCCFEALFKAVATDSSAGDCTMVYGRSLCKGLAQQDPAKALMNADSFGYYVLDAGNPKTFGA